jgi:O-acetylserine/cysteine efflux transporter
MDGPRRLGYRRPMTRRQILLAFVPPLCFGTGFSAAKPVVGHFPPLFMMLLVYSAIALWFLLTSRDRLKTPWTAILLISACAVTIQGALLFTGLQSLTATTSNLLLQIQVPFAVLLGWLLLGEALDLRKASGTGLALAGVALVIGLPEEKPPLGPALLVLVSAFIWALGQVLARKLSRDDGLGILKANAFGAVPQLAVATLLLERGQWQALTSAGPVQWAALAFVAIVGFYAAYAAWFTVLKECRIDEAAPFMLLMPVVGIVAAAVVLGETISAAQVAGGVVILAGLALITGLDRKLRRA